LKQDEGVAGRGLKQDKVVLVSSFDPASKTYSANERKEFGPMANNKVIFAGFEL